MTAYLVALAIQALAYTVSLYRARGFQMSPDGRYYERMSRGELVPPPYSRRWLLPLLMRRRRWWGAVNALAFVAVGPLVYALTESLACVWLCAWLPGFTINVRLPVLVDQLAFTLMLAAAAVYPTNPWAAAAILLVAGQVKETAPVFGAVLCPHPAILAAAAVGVAVAVTRPAAPKDQPFMLHPFATAMAKHNPLDWRSMLLPWGGVAVVAVAWGGLTATAWIALAFGYGQLLIANDEVRLYQWAAPALLVALAPYAGPWLAPALVAHPFLCGAGKQH